MGPAVFIMELFILSWEQFRTGIEKSLEFSFFSSFFPGKGIEGIITMTKMTK
jgi:hypothetical protein